MNTRHPDYTKYLAFPSGIIKDIPTHPPHSSTLETKDNSIENKRDLYNFP